MTELLPTRQAADLRRAVIDYVTTAISLADPSVASALDAFLTDERSGIFLGPYLRTRLPFAGGGDASAARVLVPSLPDWFVPYAHQSSAFARLTTSPLVSGEQDDAGFRLPKPTIVTTGTGSGKTESFLYPVLDHAARARQAGIGGIKALILYPMNALANDQAGRLAKLITENAAYRGLTAALYTGEASHQPSTIVTADSLITDREMIRGSAPDVLLTNYKMLDQLLLRRADRSLWEASASSLRYLVLDEFHTYDGAQGTDVGMLLRRLRLVLDQIAPGRVHLTPVATSATLGDGADAAGAMLDFARTVFGTDIGEDAVITESRVDLKEFVGPSRESVAMLAGDSPGGARGLSPVSFPAALSMADAVAPHLELGTPLDADALTDAVLDVLWGADGEEPVSAVAAQRSLSPRDLLLAHPLVGQILRMTTRATELGELAAGLFPWVTESGIAEDFTTALLAALSHERAREGAPRNSFPNLEAHLWLREITRVDRAVTTAPAFTWSDALDEGQDLALPAIYCRHCGRSGWGATTRAVGDDLDLRPDTIRKDAAERNGRFRALLLDVTTTDEDASETTEETSRRRYLNLGSATLDRRGPLAGDLDAAVLRVLVHAGLDADKHANDQTCPACGEKDGIRFLGTRLATLLSVSLTSLFGTPGLDLQEKKALVFTDSVQDAAHRAAFVEARSFSLTMRSVIRDALTTTPAPIATIVERMLAGATTDEQRYRLLHPTIADSDRLTAYWHQDPDRRRGYPARERERAAARVARRLAFDVGLELGLTGQVGRTLLLTGSALAQVRATDAEIDQAAERALGGSALQLVGDDTAVRRRWVRGILERLRTHGAIAHEWLEPFRREGGAVYKLWGGRPDPDLMPAFPPGRALPQLPAIGRQGERCEFEDAAARSGWYADWGARVLSRDRGTTSTFLRPLLDSLVEQGLVDVVEAKGGAMRSYALAPDRIEASLPDGGAEEPTPVLVCDECRETVTGTNNVLTPLQDGPCLRHRCPGTLRARVLQATYYRSLYQGDMRRVVAREHSSLLTTDDRLDYETSFKNSAQTPGAPNVLVATPTLEMGIDIGDLSTVLLASVPRTVASYLQRVGRAGRQTGNALDVTFVAGRGRAAGLYYDPLDLLNGTVRAPGAYLSAQEILRRQLFASILDTLAGDDRVPPPVRTTPVLASATPGTFLGHVLEELHRAGERYVERFLGRFEAGTHSWNGLAAEAREELRAWALAHGDNASGLETAVHGAVAQWNRSREELRRRRTRIQDNIEQLESQPLTEERAETIATLRAEDLLISAEQDAIGAESGLSPEEREKEGRRLRGRAGQLGAEVSALESAHWIGVLERYGLLPNFTLVDDAVALEATVIWQDEDGTWKHDPVSYTRSGASALTELAPGAHFYAHGRELVVDAVDIGIDGAALRPTAFCPRCGLAHPFERSQPPQACPVCHSAEIADAGQHRDVIDLTRVYSTMSRSRTRIGDSQEDREKVHFEQALSVSFHDARTVQRWNVVGTGFGMRLDRGTTLTRLNLGKPQSGTEKIRIAGEDRTAPGFLICSRCGHHDSDTGGNKPHDHQAWCELRYARDAENRSALLSRTLHTETVLVTLPPTLLDAAAGDLLPNFVAALQLGIETRFGGSINNLDVDVIAHPAHVDHPALLLSDTIIGGTGYLFELASAGSVWDLLTAGLRALESCPCQEEGLVACHRCLLPYVRSDLYERMSRSTAIDALHEVLGTSSPQPGAAEWTVEEREAELGTITESPLERQFRNAYITAMRSIDGADIATRGNSISVRHGGRTFTLEPQVDIAGSRPDFVLTWPGADVAGIAIFTDGHSFHATASNNRVADDAVKRMRLRRAGYMVLAITDADLQRDTARREGADVARTGDDLPLLVDPGMVQKLASSGVQYRVLEPLLRATPIELLVGVVRRGKTDRWRSLGRELPYLLIPLQDQSGLTTPDGSPAERVAADALDGKRPAPYTDPLSLAIVRARDELAAVGLLDATRRSVTLVLDDRDDALRRGTSGESWRGWLALANLAQGDPFGETLRLATWSLVDAGIDVTADSARALWIPDSDESKAPVAPASGTADFVLQPGPVMDIDLELSPGWRAALDDAADERELELIRLFSRYDIEPPVVGDEYGTGIPLEIAWPRWKVAIATDELDGRDRAELETDGWTILDPDPEQVLAALQLTRGDLS